MIYYKKDILFQEVPNEVSLGFMISGCPLKCKGCHSPESWGKHGDKTLSVEFLESQLIKYSKYITCVCFLGGEWEDTIVDLLDSCKKYGLKTCLYTGLNDVDDSIKSKLNYLKTGRWISKLGGLNNIGTNQKFINLDTNQDLTHLFVK